MSVKIIVGDVRSRIAELDAGSVQCCVTSPPYFGLRDYGVDGQIGLEDTPAAFVAELVLVFREVRRVLRDDGTLWLNLGDSYAGSGKGGNPDAGMQASNKGSQSVGCLYSTGRTAREAAVTNVTRKTFEGIKAKDLIGIPWRVAFALQEDGWYLRSDIIWHKPNPMPESVTDRPTSAHEHIFLLTKSRRYFYDADAIRESGVQPPEKFGTGGALGSLQKQGYSKASGRNRDNSGGYGTESERNARNVWTIATRPYSGAHFATFPPELAERCIEAGCPAGGTVLDPFGGAGTTGLVADRLQRNAVLIELNPTYAEMARARIAGESGMFSSVEVAA